MNKLDQFNWIARGYDRLSEFVFGESLQNSQLHFISEISTNNKVLIIGGGTGKFLKALLQRQPSIEVYYLEASSRMIALAKKLVHDDPSVTFIHGNENSIPTEIQFDVIITNFFLDLFNGKTVMVMIEKLSDVLRPGGKWLVTDFNENSKLKHRVLLKVMYLFFRMTSGIEASRMPPWRDAIEKRNFVALREAKFVDGFVCAFVFQKIQ